MSWIDDMNRDMKITEFTVTVELTVDEKFVVRAHTPEEAAYRTGIIVHARYGAQAANASRVVRITMGSA